jgi:hypothetical protein
MKKQAKAKKDDAQFERKGSHFFGLSVETEIL